MFALKLSKPKKVRKKDKVVKKFKGNSLKIIDSDDFGSSYNQGSDLDDKEADDLPQIAEVIDERPVEIKELEKFHQGNKWKVLGNDNANTSSSGGFAPVINVRRDSDGDMSPPRMSRRDMKDTDQSPPRRRRRPGSDESPPRNRRGQDSDESPSRNRRRRGSDQSPPRTKRRDADQSPPRYRSGPDSRRSPPRKNRRHVDQSPPSNRGGYDSRQSPPRNRRRDSDQSPPRSRRRLDSDQSPPRNSRRQDQSPGRNKREHHSSQSRQRYRQDSDQSPPRSLRHRDSSNSPRRKNRSHEYDETSPSHRSESGRRPQGRHNPDGNLSPARNFWASTGRPNYRGGKDMSPPRRPGASNKYSSRQFATPEIVDEGQGEEQTLGGKKAGLQRGSALKEELMALRRKEDEMFANLDDSLSGRNAQTRVRAGKARQMEEERVKKEEEAKLEAERKAQYDKWGKGLKQIQDQVSRVDSALHEMSKPLARYSDDTDLDRHLRDQDRDGDPMLKFLAKKRGTGKSDKPKYNGPAPAPNRFNIQPGYRWDGVDRSNGYEKEWFGRINAKKALQEESYKWSVEDL